MRTNTYNITLILISDPLKAKSSSTFSYAEVDNTSDIRNTSFVCVIGVESANRVTFKSITLTISQNGDTVHTKQFAGLF